ncbi:Phage Tail Protein X [Buttiauxella agrestis]|uniref:Phage Tail Protein X n=1 Tax=Buttiauxella agrestis TaxID=82977 RepID=A0A381C5Y9_9ENTR|nr:tail protein X [Buttiauxella agrestis]SUW63305.1 Phage Tail Protein X [Buttiauxella agrestis]
MQYTTKNGEKLDVICFKKYGFVNNAVEQALYEPANYDLTTSEVFSAGTEIDLPVIKPDEKKQEYSLWE